MKWLPIEQCNKQPGVSYIVSGWGRSKVDRWYAIAHYSEEVWWDDNTLDELFPPTHFAYFSPIE